MNRPPLLRRLIGAVQVTLKPILIATLILFVVFPTTTVLTVTSSAKVRHPSHDNYRGYRENDQDVDTTLPKFEGMLGSHGKMLVELVARDTELSLSTEIWRGKGANRGADIKDRQESQPSKRTAVAHELVPASTNTRDTSRSWGPPRALTAMIVGAEDDLSKFETTPNFHDDQSAAQEISTRNAQALGGGWGRQRPKPKKTPPPGIAMSPASDILSRKIPCHRCPPSIGPVDDSIQAESLESRQFGDQYRKPHNKSLQHKSPAQRDCDSGSDTQQYSKPTRVKDSNMTSWEPSAKNATIVSSQAYLNNATILPNNGTNNGTTNDSAKDQGASGIYFLYIVLVVVGFCMFLLSVVMLRHACIHRRRRNAINSRKKEYPITASQQMDGPPADISTQNTARASNGSNKMKRIDEEVAEVAPIVQSGGARDGWTRWLLQKRATQKPDQMSPTRRDLSYRISTLKFLHPTFPTVRKFSGMPSEESIGENIKMKGRGGSKKNWTSTV